MTTDVRKLSGYDKMRGDAESAVEVSESAVERLVMPFADGEMDNDINNPTEKEFLAYCAEVCPDRFSNSSGDSFWFCDYESETVIASWNDLNQLAVVIESLSENGDIRFSFLDMMLTNERSSIIKTFKNFIIEKSLVHSNS